jgi:solute carrier family 25 carnitine/acylcarnitine transporter 20/29
MSTELNPTQNLGLGVMTAVVEGLLLQPTLYWKNARAMKLPFTINPRIIYRGTAASMFNEIQMMGLQFGITGFFQKLFTSSSENRQMSHFQGFFSATLGGMISACATSPIELVMIQQQRYGGTFIGTPVRVIRDHGILKTGMMRGVLPAILRDSIYVSGLLGFTPIFQDLLIRDYGMSNINASMCASMIGGMLASIPSHPFDICKTCMQGDMGQSVYKGLISTFKALWSEGGLRRMYNGCMWRTINITATVFIANECRVHLPAYIIKFS